MPSEHRPEDLQTEADDLRAQLAEVERDHQVEIDDLKQQLAAIGDECDGYEKEIKELQNGAVEDARRVEEVEALLRIALDVIYRETGINEADLLWTANHVDPVRALHNMGCGRASPAVRRERGSR